MAGILFDMELDQEIPHTPFIFQNTSQELDE